MIIFNNVCFSKFNNVYITCEKSNREIDIYEAIRSIATNLDDFKLDYTVDNDILYINKIHYTENSSRLQKLCAKYNGTIEYNNNEITIIFK